MSKRLSPGLPLADRLAAKYVETPGGCWRWMDRLDSNGYGRLRVGPRMVFAHRAMLIARGVSIPTGYEVDHLCRHPWCCNPMHLDAVPPHVNNRRSGSPSALNAVKTRCDHGHEFTSENTRTRRDGARICRVCSRQRSAEYKARRAGE